jgi:Ca-activated chloride channel family protein
MLELPAQRDSRVSFAMSSHDSISRRIAALAALLLLCAAAAVVFARPPHQSAGAGQGTISVETSLVVLPVRVTGADGDFVSGLTQQQFRVYEDGRPQPITIFQQEDTPVTVGLVVDHSRSMVPKLQGVADAASAFAQSSNPKDEMFVVDFGDNVSVVLPGGKPFSSNPQELAEAVSAVSAHGMTALYDAVAAGLKHLELGRSDKKALIIVSDGGDNASTHKYAEILDLARRSQAVIYAIGLVGSSEAEENPGALRRLCKDTGGLAFFPEKGESVSEISATIARDLREQYTIGYAPEKRQDGTFRKIRVEVKAPGRGKLEVRTRSGYFAVPPKQSVAEAGKDRP